jgi:hypothetical protein
MYIKMNVYRNICDIDITGLLSFSGFCHFETANANIRWHLSEAELWRAVRMVQQGATLRQIGAVLGAHHTVITRAWERYQLHGTPASRHVGGRQKVTTPAQDRFLVVARCVRFEKTLLMLRGSVFFYAGGCMKVFCCGKDLANVSP